MHMVTLLLLLACCGCIVSTLINLYFLVTIIFQCKYLNLDSFYISKTPLHFNAGVVFIFYLILSQLENLEIERICSILGSSQKEHSVGLFLDTPLLKELSIFLVSFLFLCSKSIYLCSSLT